MVKKVRYIILIVLCLFLIQCNVEKEVNINLPDYPDTPYLECYLEPGKPFRLVSYYSLSYFGALTPSPVRDAEITITHRGLTVSLPYDSIPHAGDVRYYNYRSNDSVTVPAHYYEAFDLAVKIKGVTYTSTTTIVPAVTLDSITSNCNSKLRCQLGIRFKDQHSTVDFYRYLIFSDSIGGDVKRDFDFNDKLFSTSDVEISGFGYNFDEGQKVVVQLFHLTKEHYEFLVSVKDAQNANGNPFAQPSSIKSNIPGLIGIFTGLTYDSKEEYIP